MIEQAAEAQAGPRRSASIGLEDKLGVIVTASEGWHPGVVGLVASRLKERTFAPRFCHSAASPAASAPARAARSPASIFGKAVRQAVADGIC